MVKKNKLFIFCSVAPAVLAFLVIFAYPVVRTVMMSFYNLSNISAGRDEWQFVGFGNYLELFNSRIFRISMLNIAKIWLFGGVAIMVIALLMAVILTSGVRLKSFWRAAIYLPNIITAVAMANMWIHYVYNVKYGLFHSFFSAIGWESMANFTWTSPEHIFLALMIAYCFGSVGYFMLVFVSGIEKISPELYEAALLDGSNVFSSFRRITLPLLSGVFRTAFTLWTTITLSFFVWVQMFSPLQAEEQIVTPVYLMYRRAITGEIGSSASSLNVGSGAAICILLMIIAVVMFGLINAVIKDEKLEF